MKWFLLSAFTLIIVNFQYAAAELRIGIVGLDSSHCVEFTRRFNDATDKDHVSGGKVVVAFKGGSPDMIKESWSRVEGYAKQMQEKFDVRIVNSIEELCSQADVVMLESIDGRMHLPQVKIVFKAGKPIFIDKPLAGTLSDAIRIFQLAQECKVPCFSSSSLRYYPGLVDLKKMDVGEIKGAISIGPAPTESHHPDLFWYGIHPTEALFAVMGRGCQTVVRTFTPDTDIVTGVWNDGKVGTLHALRNAHSPYRVILFGSKDVVDQKPGGDYTPFLREVVKFFQTGISPVPPEETLEIFAFMEAADESKRQGGCTVKISEVMKKAEANIR
jgi:hypothetical protein